MFNAPQLAAKFRISPEAVRRILKGKWVPSEKEMEDRRERWVKRGESIWEANVRAGKVWTKEERRRRWAVKEKRREKEEVWRGLRERWEGTAKEALGNVGEGGEGKKDTGRSKLGRVDFAVKIL